MRAMRSIFCAALSAAAVIAISIPARAQTSPDTLTADEAVHEALSANRDLQAARYAIDVARGGLLQAGRLQNPRIQGNFADDFAFDSDGERYGAVSFSQSFPVTARLARQKDVAARDVDIARAEVRNFMRNLVAEVESAFYLVRTRDEQLGVNLLLVASIRAVEEVTERRVEAAEASPAEVGLLRIERMRLEQGAQRLVREREVAAAALARLLGRKLLAQTTPVGALDPGPSALPPMTMGGTVRPDLEAAARGIERASADRALARSEIWEDWQVDLGYARDHSVFNAPVGIDDDQYISIGFSIPLPIWNRQQGRIAAAEAEHRRASRSRDALALRVQEEIRAAKARVRTLRLSVDAYADEILPETTRTQELFNRGYRQGLMGIAELFQAQRQYNDSLAFYVQLQGDLRQAVIALEAATGSSPHLIEPLGSGGNTP